MISDAVFPVEPWQVREATLDRDLLAQTESVFALSNGHLGLGHAWSSRRSPQAVRDQVAAALNGARFAGWDGSRAARPDPRTSRWGFPSCAAGQLAGP